ncbi:MAG: Tn3 family transposase [Desulforhopalus sp.]|nr:Tn3 family transposase [Desulforhopalus sp.]
MPFEEHYTDTHGYTENNFAAFAMLGRRLFPRIRGLQKQHINKIDLTQSYKALMPLVGRSDHTINMDGIVDQCGIVSATFMRLLSPDHATTSTATAKRIYR